MICPFEQGEIKGREIVKNFLHTKELIKYVESKDKFSRWDIAYETGNGKFIGEVKYRNYPSTKFYDWVLEKHKYDDLMKIRDNRKENGVDVRIVYINVFTDDKIFIWDLGTEFVANIKVRVETHSKTTAVFGEKKLKEVIKLPTYKASKFNI